MKKLLILIVFAAVYLHFYPEPKLTAWYLEQKAMLTGKMAKATDTKVRLKADKIFTDLKPEFKSFNSAEIDYLKEITTSRETVVAFNDKYCQKEHTYNAKLHQANLLKVCKTISNYAALL